MASRNTPRFLTLLCIFSIIGGILAVKSSFTGLFMHEQIDASEMSMNFNYDGEGELPSFVQYITESLLDFWTMQQEYSRVLNASTLLLALISLTGVIMMYRLNSKGFILYSIANLLAVIIPFFYFLNNTIGQLFIALQFFVSALFILLYASQLKYMRKDAVKKL
jgi:hypothetical protein